MGQNNFSKAGETAHSLGVLIVIMLEYIFKLNMSDFAQYGRSQTEFVHTPEKGAPRDSEK